MPKAGDKVICLEDESLATVVSLTAGGSPDIVFSDGSRGTYLLHEFAELFGYVTPPAAQPEYCGPSSTAQKLAEMVMSDCGHSSNNQRLLDRIADRIQRHIDATTPPVQQPEQEPVAIALNTGTKQGVKWLKNVEHGENLYTTPPAAQRKPLTDEQIYAMCSDFHSWSEWDGGNFQKFWLDLCRAIEAAHGIGENT
jgi:hypothetical protein